MPACRSHIAHQLRTRNDFARAASKCPCARGAVLTVSPVGTIAGIVRNAAVVTMCVVMALTMSPSTAADPDVQPASAATPPNDGLVPSNPPEIVNTPDGWRLGLGAKDEAQTPVAPLTTAVSSREYIATGTFVGDLSGPGQPQGILEAGYEIGCGIDMSTSNGVDLGGNMGIAPGLSPTFDTTGMLPPLLPFITVPVNGSINVGLKPGFVIVVPVSKKQFKGPHPWIMIANFHVRIDGCVGQSFIRSYATLTRVTDQSDVVLSYVGVTKAV